MHYGSHAFSINGEATIKVINAPDDTQLGQRGGMSDIDVISVNSLYHCDHGMNKLILP